eukprot:3715320-Prymnesium_polylepis.3
MLAAPCSSKWKRRMNGIGRGRTRLIRMTAANCRSSRQSRVTTTAPTACPPASAKCLPACSAPWLSAVARAQPQSSPRALSANAT